MDKPIPEAWMTPGGDVSRSFYWCLERCLPGQQPRPLYAAQQRQEVAWMCWHPNINDGRLMPMERDLTPEAKAVGWQSRPLVYGDIAPQPTQQGGGEVIQRHVVTKYRDGSSHVADVTAPPSAPVGTAEDMVLATIERRESIAPVGVDASGSRAWMAEVCRAAALSLAAHGVRNDQLSKVADWITQQPAAMGEARDLIGALQVAELALRERGLQASGEYRQIEATLAKYAGQQPAAVDEVLTPTGTFCSVCEAPQHNTPSGVSCLNGHGGVAALNQQPTAVEENRDVWRTLWLVLRQTGTVDVPLYDIASADWSKCQIEQTEHQLTGAVRLRATLLATQNQEPTT